jgi:hypothetical protein
MNIRILPNSDPKPKPPPDLPTRTPAGNGYPVGGERQPVPQA